MAGLVTNTVNSITGKADTSITCKEAQSVVLLTALASSIGGGLYTRTRVKAGKDPIFNVLF